MRPRKYLAALLVAFSLGAYQPAYAEIGCTFPVNFYNIDPNGWVAVNLQLAASTKTWYICSLSGSVSVTTGYEVAPATTTVTSEACKGLASQLLTARASARPVQLWFKSATTCDDAALPPTWTVPNQYPFHIIF